MKATRALILCAFICQSGAGGAVDCARGGTPGATLLVPYFRVSRNGVTNAATDIPDVAGQTDTLLALTNVSNTGLIVHAAIWSKYGTPVLGFNIPLTAKDVVTFRMKDVLNGKLNVNASFGAFSPAKDPCGINQTSGAYAPYVGFGATRFIRFSNPDPADAHRAISVYQTPAFSGQFRKLVWDSLDESGDITSLTAPGAFAIDHDTACGGAPVDGELAGDFSGYATFDVVNYCTNFFPTDREYWANDAIATAGWEDPVSTPNVLMGDVFYVDSSSTDSNISGDPMVSLRYKRDLGGWSGQKTFYGRYDTLGDAANPAVPPAYRFVGDGREALGTHYAFRYLNDAGQGLRSWAIAWRSDRYADPSGPQTDLCRWWARAPANFGYGFWDRQHSIIIHTYDADENEYVGSCHGPPPCPEPLPPYLFLETQRIDLLGNGDVNPEFYRGGWIDLEMPGSRYSQAFVGVQHSGLGAFLSTGHSAHPLDLSECPAIALPASRPDPP
jgi:hypothetical protein